MEPAAWPFRRLRGLEYGVILGVLVLVAPGVTAASPADTTLPAPHSVPDSARLAGLAARLRDLNRVRVVADGRQFLASDPVATTEGLRFRSITTREEGFAYHTVEDPPPVRWAEIESIHAQGHATRNGALLGALGGGIIGFAIGASQPCQPGSILAGTEGNCATRQGAPILLGTLGGAFLGALIGHRFESWQPVYP